MADGDNSIEVVVYRSSRRADTYLFLPQDGAYDDLPSALREQFGEATAFLNFDLHADRFLAQAEPDAVMQAIAEQGFYLQLPPQQEAE